MTPGAGGASCFRNLPDFATVRFSILRERAPSGGASAACKSMSAVMQTRYGVTRRSPEMTRVRCAPPRPTAQHHGFGLPRLQLSHHKWRALEPQNVVSVGYNLGDATWRRGQKQPQKTCVGHEFDWHRPISSSAHSSISRMTARANCPIQGHSRLDFVEQCPAIGHHKARWCFQKRWSLWWPDSYNILGQGQL